MPNRLINEKSPYLLQHADNPVEWFPWNEETFILAKELDKPIFLSIGYSTCHWCHVMERESFEDLETANILNDVFISIKVDKEERPDIDHTYMSVCQMLTGSGGWPLTIFLTPDKKPFYADTYIPKEDRYGKHGLKSLIEKVRYLWKNKRDEIENSGNEIFNQINKDNDFNVKNTEIDNEIFNKAFEILKKLYDEINGGFGRAPKFPTPHNLIFLLNYWSEFKKKDSLEMVIKTLYSIRKGGIYDHIGMGFHRYSTDAGWLIPHFEKMLYDQALISGAYLETYRITKEPFFLDTAEEIFEYIFRDMTDERGRFYSAEDADSEGIEGKFYMWTRDDLISLLEPEEFIFVEQYFNIKEDGNFMDFHQHTISNRNILHVPVSISELADLSPEEKENFDQQIKNIREKLFSARIKRIPPFKDKKILTDWNSLMIISLIEAAKLTANTKYAIAAKAALDEILENYKKNKNLSHIIDEDKFIPAFLDDYAFFIEALIKYYEYSFDATYLIYAFNLNNYLLEEFYDSEKHIFNFTPKTGSDILLRKPILNDSAIPAGNSIAISNLLKLSIFSDNHIFEKKADESINSLSYLLNSFPSSFLSLINMYLKTKKPKNLLIIAGNSIDNTIIDSLKKYGILWTPEISIIILTPENRELLAKFNKNLSNYGQINRETTYFFCRNFSCLSPTNDLKSILNEIK
jgi:uncharacterized protein